MNTKILTIVEPDCSQFLPELLIRLAKPHIFPGVCHRTERQWSHPSETISFVVQLP